MFAELPFANRRYRRDSGAAAVEFALLVPILLILVFGIISFGIVLAQQLTLSNSARQAARFVVTQDRTCADVMNEVTSSASTIAMDASNVTVEVRTAGAGSLTCGPAQGAFSPTDAAKKPCVGTAPDSSIEVTTRYRSSLIIPLLVVNDNFTLSSRGVFRCEYH